MPVHAGPLLRSLCCKIYKPDEDKVRAYMCTQKENAVRATAGRSCMYESPAPDAQRAPQFVGGRFAGRQFAGASCDFGLRAGSSRCMLPPWFAGRHFAVHPGTLVCGQILVQKGHEILYETENRIFPEITSEPNKRVKPGGL